MQSELNLIGEAKKNYKFLIINYAHLKSKINLYNIYLKEENFLKALSLINEVLSIFCFLGTDIQNPVEAHP